MLEMICLFFPAIFAVFITEVFGKREVPFKKGVYLFATYTLAINSFVLALKYFVFKTGAMPLSTEYGMTVNTAIKYLILAVPLAVLIGLIGSRIRIRTHKVRKTNKG